MAKTKRYDLERDLLKGKMFRYDRASTGERATLQGANPKPTPNRRFAFGFKTSRKERY
ncbi:MAG: hypothetical protein ACFFCO_07035 [Promethearchaeota archaeon]